MGCSPGSWGYIDDIVDALERFFWRDPIDCSGPLNIGNDREVAVLTVAEYVTRLVPGVRIAFAPPTPQDPSNRCPDLTLAVACCPDGRPRFHTRTGYAIRSRGSGASWESPHRRGLDPIWNQWSLANCRPVAMSVSVPASA